MSRVKEKHTWPVALVRTRIFRPLPAHQLFGEFLIPKKRPSERSGGGATDLNRTACANNEWDGPPVCPSNASTIATRKSCHDSAASRRVVLRSILAFGFALAIERESPSFHPFRNREWEAGG